MLPFLILILQTLLTASSHSSAASNLPHLPEHPDDTTRDGYPMSSAAANGALPIQAPNQAEKERKTEMVVKKTREILSNSERTLPGAPAAAANKIYTGVAINDPETLKTVAGAFFEAIIDDLERGGRQWTRFLADVMNELRKFNIRFRDEDKLITWTSCILNLTQDNFEELCNVLNTFPREECPSEETLVTESTKKQNEDKKHVIVRGVIGGGELLNAEFSPDTTFRKVHRAIVSADERAYVTLFTDMGCANRLDYRTTLADFHQEDPNHPIEIFAIKMSRREFELIALVSFIGELYVRKLLAARVIAQVVHDLIGVRDKQPLPAPIRAACELLKIVGPTMDSNTQGHMLMSQFLSRLQNLAESKLAGSEEYRYNQEIRDVVSKTNTARDQGWPRDTPASRD